MVVGARNFLVIADNLRAESQTERYN